jgi:hypothetical protein
MTTYKLLVALALLTNPDAAPSYETWPEVFPFIGWEAKCASESGDEYLFYLPFSCLGDFVLTQANCFQPVSGSARAHAFIAPTLRDLAIKLELMDPREVNYLLHDPQNFPQDLKQLQRRFVDLSDAPAVVECERFPDRDAAGELMAANRGYREELNQRLELDQVHADEIQQAIDEADQLHQVWTTVREARCGFYYVNVRRQALKQLRDMIGEPAFYRGELPPHLPVWRVPRTR